jgi:hypothetical protein
MRDFFASLRMMLAYVDLERMNLGTIAHQFIKAEIVPRLSHKLDAAVTDTEKARLAGLIAEYGKYADPRSPEGRVFSKKAADIVRTLAQRSRLGDEEMEDLMQDLALDFFKPLSEGGQDLRGTMMKFLHEGEGEEQGPVKLLNYWARIVHWRTQYKMREYQRHYREKTIEMQESDEGKARDPMEQIPAQSPIDESHIQDVMRDLTKYIHGHVKPKLAEMFDLWFEAAKDKGPTGVDLKKDVYVVMKDRNPGMYPSEHSYSTFIVEHWPQVKRAILSFFQAELGASGVAGVKRMLRLGTAEALTVVMYRRRLAAWMLGGVLWGTIKAEDA